MYRTVQDDIVHDETADISACTSRKLFAYHGSIFEERISLFS